MRSFSYERAFNFFFCDNVLCLVYGTHCKQHDSRKHAGKTLKFCVQHFKQKKDISEAINNRAQRIKVVSDSNS